MHWPARVILRIPGAETSLHGLILMRRKRNDNSPDGLTESCNQNELIHSG
jgi:hypothetical protein